MPFFRRRPKPAPPDPWSPDLPILNLTSRDKWCLRDAFEGVQVFGAIGSGKTSGSGQALAKAFLQEGFGGLVLTAKQNEVDLWRTYARATGTESRLLVVSPDSPYRFNFLEYECRRPEGRETENLVGLFYSILETIEGEESGTTDSYWGRTLKQLLRNAIDMVSIAEDTITLAALEELIKSAPKSQDDLLSESWRTHSYCYQCLDGGDARINSGLVPASRRDDFIKASSYWMREFPALSDKTRSIIESCFTSMIDSLLRGELCEFLCTTTTFDPDASQDGKVIVLDFPIKKWRDLGRNVQLIFKYLWQGAVERRRGEALRRPVFLWADEAQFFLSSRDPDFQSTARESRACTVYLTQNISNYYAILRNRDRVSAFLGNLNTKIFHSNTDSTTNEWAADMIARSWQDRSTINTNQEDLKDKSSVSLSQSLEHDVIPQTFTRLRNGGDRNKRHVDAIFLQGGRIWSNGKSYLKLVFRQDQL